MDVNGAAFDPRAPAFRTNPYPTYDLVRATAPVLTGTSGVSGFSAATMIAAPCCATRAWAMPRWRVSRPKSSALFEMQRRWMLVRNPPDHTRLRTPVHKTFTPRVVEQMRSHIQAITDDLLDRIVAAGQADLIADLAYPLPVTVIAELLGIPTSDLPQFHVWSNDLAGSLDLTDDPAVYNQAARAASAMADYLRAIIAQRRRQPQDDLLSALIAAEEGGGRLSEDELYATCALLLIAGHETTINLIGSPNHICWTSTVTPTHIWPSARASTIA
jgi:pimeloyl-[acyl-carrier protein] synthase